MHSALQAGDQLNAVLAALNLDSVLPWPARRVRREPASQTTSLQGHDPLSWHCAAGHVVQHRPLPHPAQLSAIPRPTRNPSPPPPPRPVSRDDGGERGRPRDSGDSPTAFRVTFNSLQWPPVRHVHRRRYRVSSACSSSRTCKRRRHTSWKSEKPEMRD